MSTADSPLRLIVFVAAAATLVSVGSTAVSASTDTTEPVGTLAVDGSAQPTSPEAGEFCQAEVDLEAASASGTPEEVRAAADALVALAPVEVAPAAEALIASAENPADDSGSAYAVAYAEMLGYMRANCGFAELDVTASEYAFDGLPSEVPSGPAIVAFENIGEEVHEIVILRMLDGSTSIEELLALPQEERATETAFAGAAFALPGEIGPSHYTLGMIQEFHV